MINNIRKHFYIFIFIILHSCEFYESVINYGSVSMLPDVCPNIEYNNRTQWIKHNTDAHNKLCKQKPLLDAYDFIIVGAGAAGSVIASRLSENSRVTVLLIEAGGCENASSDIPALWARLLGSQCDWNYKAEPQLNGTFINTYRNGCPTINRGKSMGGSTAINGMNYFRGAPKDFDNWEKLGAYDWQYTRVLPYFLRSEGNRDPKYANNGYHNNSGPLVVSSNSLNMSRNLLIKPCEELGFKQIDLNGVDIIGVDYSQQTIDNGVRVSVSKAFLEPVIDQRANLHILANSHVTRVLISTKTKSAYGVEYRHHNTLLTIKARKEVILSAGVINSPQLLLLSGVGSRKQLNKFKIPVIAELIGVGLNLRDHPLVIGPSFVFNGTNDKMREICRKYSSNRSGKLSHLDMQCFNVKSVINKDENWNDIQIWLQSSSSGNTIVTAVVNVRPKSIGYLELRSSDPLDHPIIQPNYLTHSDDILVLKDGLRWLYRIANTDSYKGFGNQVLSNRVRGCGKKLNYIRDTKYPNMKIPCDEHLDCVVRHMTSSAFHLSGTCKMGSPLVNLSVVNSRLQVLGGIQGLRVADASVMPVVTNAHTMAPTVMIGERCAEFIKHDYRL